MVKTGFGLDIHKLELERPCILGGVEINSKYGPVGHSDADVVIHALIDALLGATALGDIGQWFPDNDPKYKNIDSTILLKQVFDVIKAKRYIIEHVDITIVAEKPRIAPYCLAIRTSLAGQLQIEISALSIKATTSEKMGFIGNKEGIAAVAVVTLSQKNINKSQQQEKINFQQLSPQNLAYIGDAVFELYIRKYLVARGIKKGYQLQKKALQYVSANAQAQMIQMVFESLSEEEQRILKWGRNSSSGNIPKNTDAVSYRYSTGLEALLGYLYLDDDIVRLEELIETLINKRNISLEEEKTC